MLVKTRDIAEKAGVTVPTVIRWIKKGKVDAIKIRKVYRILKYELDKIEKELSQLDDWFTPQEVANILTVSISTVYEMIKNGEIKAIKIGGRYRIPVSEVKKILGKYYDIVIGGGNE